MPGLLARGVGADILAGGGAACRGSAFRHLARLPQLEAVALRVNRMPEAAVAGLGHLIVDCGAGRPQLLEHGVEGIDPEVQHGLLLQPAEVVRVGRKRREHGGAGLLRPRPLRVHAGDAQVGLIPGRQAGRVLGAEEEAADAGDALHGGTVHAAAARERAHRWASPMYCRCGLQRRFATRAGRGKTGADDHSTKGLRMPRRVVLLVGTRKGCFVMESDLDRRDWRIRGPYCDGWPVYHAIYDGESGTIYAAAASEWHGSGIWRSGDLGESWQLSSEGLGYGEDGELKLSKVSGLSAGHGRVLAGAEAAGVFESRDGGATWSLKSTLDGQPGRELWNIPDNQPPGHLGLPAILPHPDEASRFWAIVQGFGIFETTDDGASWTPRNKGLRADWPLENPEVGYCVHKLVMSPRDNDRMYQQNHV